VLIGAFSLLSSIEISPIEVVISTYTVFSWSLVSSATGASVFGGSVLAGWVFGGSFPCAAAAEAKKSEAARVRPARKVGIVVISGFQRCEDGHARAHFRPHEVYAPCLAPSQPHEPTSTANLTTDPTMIRTLRTTPIAGTKLP